MPLIEHTDGNYWFLPGIAAYSCGVVACPGYEIVHVTLRQPIAYQGGFDRIADFLSAQQRPKAALCGVELRSPAPYSFAGFSELNAEYAGILADWDVFVDGINPVARTNVAPVLGAPSKPALYGFSFTQPSDANLPQTFVVAGAGELPEGKLEPAAIVARGDFSRAGMLQKAHAVMELMHGRLLQLGGQWSEVTHVNVYTTRFDASLVTDIVLPRATTGNVDGIVWHYSRPPVEEIEFEMDMRGVRTEFRLDLD